MKSRKPSRPASAIAAALIAVLLAWTLGNRNSSDSASPTAITSKPKSPATDATWDRPEADWELWEIDEADSGRRFTVALDRVAKPRDDGTCTIEKLSPPATRATLPARLLAMGAQAVAYESGPGRGAESLRIVTRDLRVKWAGVGDLSSMLSLGFAVKSRPSYAPGWLVLRARDSLAALEILGQLRATPGVITADILLARQQSPRLMPNDPLIDRQWHLNRQASGEAITDINVESAWDFANGLGVRGSGIRIGIIDDGFDLLHQDLAAGFAPALAWDWNGNDAIPAAATGDNHGTACAGNAAARGNNGLGGSGVAPESTLVGLRLISSPSTDEQEAEAFAWENAEIQIKSNSWGPSDSGRLLEEPGPLTRAALEDACAKGRGGRGTIFVWAAGNGAEAGDNSNYDGYANSIHTLAVGAVDSTGHPANYAERGSNVMVCAPSNGAFPALGITTTDRTGTDGYHSAGSASGGDYTHTFSGTSSATPVVAGVVALMLEKNPQLGWRDVQEIVMASATRIFPNSSEWKPNGAGMKFHPRIGAGVIDASAAVEMAALWENLPPATHASKIVSDLDIPIPDSDSHGIALDIPLPTASLRTEHVTVKVSIRHPSRGNLQIVLTSPSGTRSTLAEVHNDTNDDYDGWTFSTVRHWGENAAGTWLLSVADLSGSGDNAGGVLEGAELRIHGTPLIPQNPPPTVAIVDPPDGTHLSPGAVLSVHVAASDQNMDGEQANVASITLQSNGETLASLAAPPFVFTFVPTDGDHELTALAIDDEGATAVSAAISIIVSNRPPQIESAALNHLSQAYADQDLQVQSVEVADPDGESVELIYQWQWSSDGDHFELAPEDHTAILPAALDRSGKLWRCLITASDGRSTGDPYTTETVNLLDRPITSVSRGSAYHYQSGLVLRGVDTVPTRDAILHEFSQGPAGGTSEWVEILVLKQCDLGNWDLSDSSSMLIFKRVPLWSEVPAGTLITIYHGNTTRDPALPADDLDPADGRIVISSTDPDHFDNRFGSWIPLSNSGDSISLNDAASKLVHALSYGNHNLHPLNPGAVGAGKAAHFTANSERAATSSAAWEVIDASGSVTPGYPNNEANARFITTLKNHSYQTPADFKLAPGSTLPTGLALHPQTGVISGTVAANASESPHVVEIHRTNEAAERVSQTYVLTVLPADGFTEWLADFPALSDPSPGGDPDADGLPNLVEYATGSSPASASIGPHLEWGEGALSLIYQKSKTAVDVDLHAEWSENPDASDSWSVEGVSIEILSETATHHTFRAAIFIPVGTTKCFMRLRATLIPGS